MRKKRKKRTPRRCVRQARASKRVEVKKQKQLQKEKMSMEKRSTRMKKQERRRAYERRERPPTAARRVAIELEGSMAAIAKDSLHEQMWAKEAEETREVSREASACGCGGGEAAWLACLALVWRPIAHSGTRRRTDEKGMKGEK